MINVPALRESNVRNPLQPVCHSFASTWSRRPSLLPASLPPAAGGRLGRPGGDDLAVDGAEKQHEPDGAKHLGGWDAMILVDGHVEERRCHCGGAGVNSSVKLFKLSTSIMNHNSEAFNKG